MPSRALLVVPPLFKTLNQPLLGPAMLLGAGRAAGHDVELVDLNQRYLRERLPADAAANAAQFVGDHNRPSPLLRGIQAGFSAMLREVLPEPDTAGLDEDPAMSLTFDHEEVRAAANRLAAGALGVWARAHLAASPRPDVVGLSIFYSGQVLAALAVSIIARELWPGVIIVWGGPHVTTLEHEIPSDRRYGCGLIDGFVFGYAEATWTSLLDAVEAGSSWPPEVVAAGSGAGHRAQGDPAVVPAFDDLDRYGWGRLCLPAQSSRGCIYGNCTQCTYPAVEGEYAASPLAPIESVVALAERRGAAVAFKDALVHPRRLEELAAVVGGRVRWSACTKLHPRLRDPELLRGLESAGLHTLEVGLETLTDDGQLLLDKKQVLPLFLGFLDAAWGAGIAVVVNYMTGLPGVDALSEQRWLDRVHRELAARPGLVARVEHNVLQVERRAPLGQRPERFRIRVVRSWPWASVVAWRVELAWAAR